MKIMDANLAQQNQKDNIPTFTDGLDYDSKVFKAFKERLKKNNRPSYQYYRELAAYYNVNESYFIPVANEMASGETIKYASKVDRARVLWGLCKANADTKAKMHAYFNNSLTKSL